MIPRDTRKASYGYEEDGEKQEEEHVAHDKAASMALDCMMLITIILSILRMCAR